MGEKEMTVSRLGRYEVIRQLGKGAMGVVYLGRDPVIGRLVALKTIRVGASTDEDEAREFQERFVREAQAAGILNHPAIVTVHDIGQDTGLEVSFIAMEYVEGRNLKELVVGNDVPPYPDLCEILAQVADALEYAHLKGIVHRDVKSANIIVCEGNRAKITDFGIAKIASHSSNLTSTGQFLGTPNYMAPEQVKGTPVDGRTDLFSFGIVLYEALTGKKPFAGDSLTSISYKIVHEPFPPARSFDPEIPRGFEPILSKCMAKEPSLRYQRGRDLAADLRKLADSLLEAERAATGGATPDSSVTRVRESSDPRATIEISKDDLLVHEDEEVDHPEPVFDESPGDISDSARRLAEKAKAEIANVVRRATPSKGIRTPIPIWLGVVIAVALLGWLTWWGLSIRNETLEPPVEDFTLAGEVAERRALAAEARTLLRGGDSEAALAKYKELKQLAPDNTWVDENIAEIEKELRASAFDRRKRAVARGKFDIARRFYDEGDYEAAIPLFQEAFSADANMPEDPGLYLRLSSEKRALQDLIGRKIVIPPPDKSGVVVRFSSTVDDGYVAISANRRTVLKENLWEERSGFVGRRVPTTVYTYRNVDSGETKLVVEVNVPAIRFRESRTFDVMLEQGTLYHVEVTLDRRAKDLSVALTSGGVPVKPIEREPPAETE
jgi:serine/threonine protein kinase